MSKYEDSNGYEIFDIKYGTFYWFEKYEEMINTFGRLLVWDCENEIYIIQQEHEDEELTKFLDNLYITKP